MRLSYKIIGFLWVILLLIIGALLFNAYSKLRPETFIGLITEQVQRNYPGSKMEVSKISYGLSLDFNLNLQDIRLRRNEKTLASIGEVEIKIPWWLFLSNRGNAQINLKKLNIYVDQDFNNRLQEKKQVHKLDKIKINFPRYIADAKYTLRAMDVTVSDINTGRRFFIISKLMVREFHYLKNSAFELNIPLIIKNKNAHYNSDLWLFGDITLKAREWLMNFRGEFRTKENNDKFQLEDLVIGGTAAINPSDFKVNSNVELSIDKKSVGSGKITANNGELNLDVALTSLPASYLHFVYDDIKNVFLSSLQGKTSGVIKFQKNLDTSLASLTGKLGFDGSFKLSETTFIPGQWKIGLQDSRWEVSFMSPKGEASYFKRSILDSHLKSVIQYSEEIGFSGLDLGVAASPIVPVAKFINEKFPSYFTTTISYKDCLLGDQIMNGQFKYGFTPEQRFYKGTLSDQKKSFDLSYSDKQLSHAVDIIFKNFKWNSAYHFLSPLFEAQDGIINGKLSGRWSKEWDSGEWIINLAATNILEEKGKIPDFLFKTASYFEIIPNHFNNKTFNVSAKNGAISLSSVFFKNDEFIKITGLLGTKQKSFLSLFSKANKKLQRKEVLEPYWIQKD
jgi:hypothetical protein